jgi:hypothetical protein
MPDSIRVAFDASTVIAMDNPHVKMLDLTLSYFSKMGYVLIMCTENLVECFTQKARLRASGVLNEVTEVDGGIFFRVKNFCKQTNNHLNNDNDYKGIATAIQEKCKFFVSNDFKQKIAAQSYAESKSIELQSVKPPQFLLHMYLQNRILFPWHKDIECAVNLYQHEELPNIFEGIQNRGWNLSDALDRFTSYGMNINTTIQDHLTVEGTRASETH